MLTEKAALVTGGSRGIGLAIARALASAGAEVVVTGRDERALAAASSGTKGRGTVHAVRADVRDPDGAAHAVTEAVRLCGGLDILVNNAGVGVFTPVAEMSIEDWQKTIETNLGGVFYCCRAAIPALRQRGGGWIINISSLASVNPFARGAAYCASKAGLNAFSEALMQEVRHDSIRVTTILPGSVGTEFGGPGGHGQADWKIGPEDIGQAVLDLLASPARTHPSRLDLRPSMPPKK